MTNSKLTIAGPRIDGDDAILTDQALAFVAQLVERFEDRRQELLAARVEAQARFDAGQDPDFLPATEKIRERDWKVARLPDDLQRRAVEITGPVDRKMIINALNSGADVFMADFEDSNAPTWNNVVGGQINLRDAVRGTIRYVHPDKGKVYELGARPATLMVRPRGWHLDEAHVTLGGKPISGSLLDFGLFFFHNAAALVAKGSGPYFYLPKLQSHLEARLWNDVFVQAQKALGIPNGTIKATVLIETLPAVFEMDEILYELRDHSAGLNCGRWDYIFSYIKTFRNRADRVLPDRGQVGMTQPMMSAYTQLLIKTCHRRGAFAMGGMAAQIPIKGDPEANEAALAKVRADKEREAKSGHDGTWVAHPGLVAVARECFDQVLGSKPNQLHVMREDVEVGQADLLATPTGTRTDAGLRQNIRVGIQYLEAWLRGNGCVPLYNLMEDAATAEISRTQIWQWLRHGATTEDSRAITVERVEKTTDEELEVVKRQVGAEAFEAGKFAEARRIFNSVATNTEDFTDFLTLPAYAEITSC
ncbi:MAG TPA: malate synthase A [Polyangiaceae bacterium]|nr:malate synthase A [Polyangiaceae bacterium]